MADAPDDALKLTPAQRALELARPWVLLAIYDPEGAPANWPLWRALLRGPFHILTLRLEALRIAPRTRAVQAVETLATLALLAAAVALFRVSGRAEGLVYWGVAAGISSLMPIWAAYLPHRLAADHPALQAAGLLAQTWTPIVTSFAFHHPHHRHPKVPTALLPQLARRGPGGGAPT